MSPPRYSLEEYADRADWWLQAIFYLLLAVCVALGTIMVKL